jgi:hypothetical protein
MHQFVNLRPRKRRQALDDILSELFGREVTILEEGTGFNFDVSNRTEFFDECAERMKGADGLYSKSKDASVSERGYCTYMALDTRNKQLVSVGFGVGNEVGRSLLGRDGDKRDTLIGGLKPDNLRTLHVLRGLLVVTIALTLTALGFLLLLSRR